MFGQLYAMQKKYNEAIKAFAEDVYFSSIEYGPQDVRTSLGFYNLSKVFEALNETEKSLACSSQVVEIWLQTLKPMFMHADSSLATEPYDFSTVVNVSVPLGLSQLREVSDMLQDICSQRSEANSPQHQVAGTQLVLGMVTALLGDLKAAYKQLDAVSQYYKGADPEKAAIITVILRRLLATTSRLRRNTTKRVDVNS
ncbi:hypothetical protein CBR_g39279 [Chara braunii]|uniref:BRO1 domain-containing protein n=1 Tax=Chara braunii TaxID=69332 RepID=A0A388K126_CHABU|nr:hypothetical protein CBR_g39279 [Chara braunii]|eukprot:GBG63736.1 hypothetical protein CBR_g39279 [Chara braunii]